MSVRAAKPRGAAPKLAGYALFVWVSLSPAERWMLDLLRRRWSDKQIRNAMMLGRNESIQLAAGLRATLGCSPNESIVERANNLGLWYDEEYPA